MWWWHQRPNRQRPNESADPKRNHLHLYVKRRCRSLAYLWDRDGRDRYASFQRSEWIVQRGGKPFAQCGCVVSAAVRHQGPPDRSGDDPCSRWTPPPFHLSQARLILHQIQKARTGVVTERALEFP